MNALFNSLRQRLPSWFTWNNIRFQWAVVGLTAMLTAIAVGYIVEYFSSIWWTGVATSTTLTVVFSAPFIFAALHSLPPAQEPWIVQKYGDLSFWWKDFTRPASIGMFNGKAVYERWDLHDFRRIFDHTGRLIASEQTINWSSIDMDWNPGDPEDIQIIITPYKTDEGLSWLALRRSPKLPDGPMADIIQDDVIIGQTSYNVH
jgi:hypothetical protein